MGHHKGCAGGFGWAENVMFHLKNVKFSVDGQDILSVDELSLAEKRKVLILGPSGCGKTTLLHLMAGLRKAQSGSILYNETDLQKLDGGARDRFRGRHFGFIFQNFHLLRHLTVADNIRLARLGAQLHPDEGKVRMLLDHLDLSSKARQKVSSLSQGEAQRVAIARAVTNDPQVIFADEPTSALDDSNTGKVMALLEEQTAKTGAMLIVATHDGRIKSRFDTVVNLENGKIAP
jgi:ABC-type lipoprotein export system ATPase subunit